MEQRPKHTDKDIEKFLRSIERREYTVVKRKKYFIVRCPCGKHNQRTVHLTPSDPNYLRNLEGWFKRLDCG